MTSDAKHAVDRILDAVRTLLDESGIHSLTYREVAKTAGMSAGTVAYYFSSRGALREAALERHHDRVQEILQPLLDAKRTPVVEDGPSVVKMMVHYAFQNRSEIRLRLATWAAAWMLPAARREQVDGLLSRIAGIEWSADWSVEERRIVTRCMVFGAQHLAALNDEDLFRLVGTDDRTVAVTRVADALSRAVAVLVTEK